MASSSTQTSPSGSPVATSSTQSWEFAFRTSSNNKSAPSSVTCRESGDQFPLEPDGGSYGPGTLSDQGDGKEGIDGWPLLAELMAVTPSFEAFSRFQKLNVKNLLYYQVELKKLERDLEEREGGDMRNPEQNSLKKGYLPCEIHKTPEVMINPKCPQWVRVEKLRKCLREYNEALLQYSQVSALAEPTTHNMRELVRWMYDKKYGDRNIAGLAGGEWGPYERKKFDSILGRLAHLFKSIFKSTPKSPYVANLVAPRGRNSTDGLSRWIAEELIPCSHDVQDLWAKPRDTKGDVERGRGDSSSEKQQDKNNKGQQGWVLDPRVVITTRFRNDHMQGKVHAQTVQSRTILGITAQISTIFACMTPVIAIFLLVTVQNLYHKLAMISCFTFLFGSGLMILADATRVQVFTATSAFLAVLVVFLPVEGN